MTYPERVDRMVSVIGAARSGPWEIALIDSWTRPIRLDPNWNGGDYYGNSRPLDGLTTSLMLITQNALHPDFFDAQFPEHDNLPEAALAGIEGEFAVTEWLWQRARERAKVSDANHLLYLARASQLFVAGHGGDLDAALERVQARSLFLPAEGDLLLRPKLAMTAHQKLLEAGRDTQLMTLDGPMGHLNGVVGMEQAAEKLRQFLNEEA
ncbi:MAG: hypothetical protein U5L08_04665 [Xanthomonadales bacterium]|nr:hypothetical protein [Xanthomonadales bacterium]